MRPDFASQNRILVQVMGVACHLVHEGPHKELSKTCYHDTRSETGINRKRDDATEPRDAFRAGRPG